MACESEKSYSIKLVKAKFTTRPDNIRQISMLPQLDIKFHFLCKSRLFEWAIEHESHDRKEPKTIAFVKQSRYRPSIKNVVRARRNIVELHHKETRDAISQVLGRLSYNLADDREKLDDMTKYVIAKASEIVQSKPTERDGLDLYFSVLAQNNRVFFEISDANY